jgi:hypothetical protein
VRRRFAHLARDTLERLGEGGRSRVTPNAFAFEGDVEHLLDLGGDDRNDPQRRNWLV